MGWEPGGHSWRPGCRTSAELLSRDPQTSDLGREVTWAGGGVSCQGWEGVGPVRPQDSLVTSKAGSGLWGP